MAGEVAPRFCAGRGAQNGPGKVLPEGATVVAPTDRGGSRARLCPGSPTRCMPRECVNSTHTFVVLFIWLYKKKQSKYILKKDMAIGCYWHKLAFQDWSVMQARGHETAGQISFDQNTSGET